MQGGLFGKEEPKEKAEKVIPDESVKVKKPPESYTVGELPEATKKALEVVAKQFVKGADIPRTGKIVEGIAKQWRADMGMNTETLKTIIRKAGIVRGFTTSQLKLFLKNLKSVWNKAMELETPIKKG